MCWSAYHTIYQDIAGEGRAVLMMPDRLSKRLLNQMPEWADLLYKKH